MNRTRIELHIERLVLEGIDRRDRRAISAALQEQLQQRLATGPLPAMLRADTTRDTLDCGAIDGGRSQTSRALGGSVAGAIWRGLSP
jgi:hypothetical protein